MTYPSLNFTLGNPLKPADESSDSGESLDDQFEGWLDKEPALSPIAVKDVNRFHSLKVDNQSLQRLSPLVTRKIISVKPRKVGKIIVNLKAGPKKDITSFKEFLKETKLSKDTAKEEAFFIYCYVYAPKKYGFTAHVNGEGKMISIKAIRKSGNKLPPSDLPVSEIHRRLIEIAKHGKERIVKTSSRRRDKIPYSRLEYDDTLLDEFIPKLQVKLANAVIVGKWYILLSEIKDENIKSFEDFTTKYHQLNHLSEHEKFMIYAVVYGRDRWRIELENISTDLDSSKEKFGVFCAPQEPEFLRDPDDSDVLVRNKLIHIAMEDPLTRRQLLKAGFKLPMKEMPSDTSAIYLSYETLDIHDDFLGDDCHLLYKLSAQPRRIAKLLTKWNSLPRQPVDNFKDFKKNYDELGKASEFEKFVVYVAIYRNKKWKLLLETNKVSGTTILRLHLRQYNSDARSFVSEFKDANITDWLTWNENIDLAYEYLDEAGFSIPFSDSLVNRIRIEKLPRHLKRWSDEMKTYPTDNFKLFTGLHPEIRELAYEEQLVLFIHAGGFQEWELILHPSLPPSSSDALGHYLRSISDSSAPEVVAVEEEGSDDESNVSTVQGDILEVTAVSAGGGAASDNASTPKVKRKKKVSYAGNIHDIKINPAEISHLITILEKNTDYAGEITTFGEFCDKYSATLATPSHKQMYALYCYYYGKAMRKIVVDAKDDYSSLSVDLFNTKEVPHKNIKPEDVARRISRIEESTAVLNVSSIDEFKQSVPGIEEVPDAELYVLYCYFYGRSVWDVTVEPTTSTPGGAANVTLLKRTQKTVKPLPQQIDVLKFKPQSQSTRKSRKVSFAGHIKDMAINPHDISRFIPIIERDISVIDISTYEKFKRRYSPLFVDATEKEMFAVYCYYYGRSIRQMMKDAEDTGIRPDVNVLAKALHTQEVPHSNIVPTNIAQKIRKIEEEGIYFDCSTLERFLRCYPELRKSTDSEQYLLYCYFYGRSVWTVTVTPTYEIKEEEVEQKSSVGPLRRVRGVDEGRSRAVPPTIGDLATSRKKKVSFVGKMSDIAINPAEISHLIPLLEKHGGTTRIKSYDEFKERYSSVLNAPTEKELYALYCYNYGKSLKELIGQSGNQDVNMVSKALHSHEIPHTNIVPEKVARRISRMESSGRRVKTDTMEDFKKGIPDINEITEEEQYILYCFFYGRSVWNVIVEPTTEMGGEAAGAAGNFIAVVKNKQKSTKAKRPYAAKRHNTAPEIRLHQLIEQDEPVSPRPTPQLTPQPTPQATPQTVNRRKDGVQSVKETRSVMLLREDTTDLDQSEDESVTPVIAQPSSNQSLCVRKFSDASQASSTVFDIHIPTGVIETKNRSRRISKSKSFSTGNDANVANNTLDVPKSSSSKRVDRSQSARCRKMSDQSATSSIFIDNDAKLPQVRVRKMSDQSYASSSAYEIQAPSESSASRRRRFSKSKSTSYDLSVMSDVPSVVATEAGKPSRPQFIKKEVHVVQHEAPSARTRKMSDQSNASSTMFDVQLPSNTKQRTRKMSDQSNASSSYFPVPPPTPSKSGRRTSITRSKTFDLSVPTEKRRDKSPLLAPTSVAPQRPVTPNKTVTTVTKKSLTPIAIPIRTQKTPTPSPAVTPMPTPSGSRKEVVTITQKDVIPMPTPSKTRKEIVTVTQKKLSAPLEEETSAAGPAEPRSAHVTVGRNLSRKESQKYKKEDVYVKRYYKSEDELGQSDVNK